MGTHRISNTLTTENVSVPDEIIFELISEAAFLHGGWDKLIQKRGPMGSMGPLGPLGPMGQMSPMGPFSRYIHIYIYIYISGP